jgi:NADH-quinone oxidoreductase subunit L
VVTETETLRWIVALPLLAAAVHGVLLGLVRRTLERSLVIAISCGSVILSFVLSLVSLLRLDGGVLVDPVYAWIGAGSFSADVTFLMDPLSAVMCLVVTGVGSLIHVYSIGYMDDDHREDKGFQRFFCYLNLFTFSMLVLVLADNLLLMFLGWEGVGLCSYLLIGFWYADRWNAYCGMKAFVVNRIGDFGFLVGIFLVFWSFQTVAFRELQLAMGGIDPRLATLIGLCLFVGAAGKSAQLPLYVWLPDAMAGPTPVSALIHAATMVTAGVYMVCRMHFLYDAAPDAASVVAWTGALTALFAATIAVAQTDIKKILAYSTVSQLGYMFVAAGCGGYTAAIFHLGTHAFFKALLFLGAGAVILAMHHEQDTDRMGGLRTRIPRTFAVVSVGVFAIAGFPPLAGFFSKDEILLAAWGSDPRLWAVLLATAALTSFYMFRLWFRTFFGECRAPDEVKSHVHEPAPVVLWPLYVLAVCSAVAGFFNFPKAWGGWFPYPSALGHFLGFEHHAPHGAPELQLALGAIGAAGAGALLAWLLYVRFPGLPARFRSRLVANKYYVDEIYDALLVRPLVRVSDAVLYRALDAGALDGALVNGTARAVRAVAADVLRHLQSGFAQAYLVLMVLGTIAVVGFLLR